MSKQYSEEEIQKALKYLINKRPEHATREQAISLLNTMQDFGEVFVDTALKQSKKQKLKK